MIKTRRFIIEIWPYTFVVAGSILTTGPEVSRAGHWEGTMVKLMRHRINL